MKRKYLYISLVSVVIMVILILLLIIISNNNKQNDNNDVSKLQKEYKDINNGNSLKNTNTTGEVIVKTDSLVFEDQKGNTMTYSFEGEELKSVEWRINFESQEAASKAKLEYEAEEFKTMYICSTENNVLVLRYTDEYINKYLNQTRSEIENNLKDGGYILKK